MKRKNKEKEINEIIKRNEENIKKKLDEYNKKQEMILERQKEREENLQKENIIRKKL